MLSVSSAVRIDVDAKQRARRTLPQAFKDKFADTYAIIDATEIFIETPCDLHNQSSTWCNYKHRNTCKLLVACTPNGAISFVSSLYLGSISDVELTRVSGFIEHLHDKPGVSIMADRGFTIKDQLLPHKVSLNIPPFMEGRARLPADEVKKRPQDSFPQDTCGESYRENEELCDCKGNLTTLNG